MTDEMLPDYAEELIADACSLASALIRTQVRDPQGPAAKSVLRSIVSSVARETSDDPEERASELAQRAERVGVIIGALAQMATRVIHTAERAGLQIHLEHLPSAYDVLLDLPDPEGESSPDRDGL